MRRNLDDALRSIAALPLDDWNDPEWSTFEAAQTVIADGPPASGVCQ